MMREVQTDRGDRAQFELPKMEPDEVTVTLKMHLSTLRAMREHWGQTGYAAAIGKSFMDNLEGDQRLAMHNWNMDFMKLADLMTKLEQELK